MLVCRSDKQWIFVGLQLAYVVLTLLAGFVLAFLTRRVADRVFFREAKWINYSVSDLGANNLITENENVCT